MKNRLLLLFLTVFIITTGVLAQTTPTKDSLQQVTVTTNDGNEFVGTIISENSTAVVLYLPSVGNITIPRQNIERIKPLVKGRTENGDEYWRENPHSTRYYFQPNGYGLSKGQGYYQNAWVFYNQVSYGLSDYFSIGVGMVPLFLFDGTPSPVWITPKVSLPIVKDKVNAGAGLLVGAVGGLRSGENTNFGIGYGILSLGSRERNVTAGFGYTFAEGETARSPVFSLSGMARTGKKFAFVSENYFFRIDGEGVGLISLGGRFFARRVSIDGALVIPRVPDQDFFIAVPWLGVNVPFGRL